MKRILPVLLSLILTLSVCIPVKAATIVDYTICNEQGEVVEEGSINLDARYTWPTDIELPSGYYVNFKNGSNAFYVDEGLSMKLTYSLNTSGTVACRFMKAASATGAGTIWSTTTKTGSSGTVTKIADDTAYYFPRISNTGSNTITITSVSLVF